ncbi:DNA repair protein rhp55 [Aspergillus udagawae]|nr:DNA repair protein rhp55 [Aspergillus udagawae]
MSAQDILGLSSQDPGRVISFPASQYLHASTASPVPGEISTGLPRLDQAIRLAPSDDPLQSSSDATLGGIPCGHVTEVFGPPGAGKTALAMSITANALCDGGKVVWIDTTSPLPKLRLKSMLMQSLDTAKSSDTPEQLMDNLVYFRAQSLPHMLALLLHPPQRFPPENTKLLVVDSVSGPFPSYFLSPSEMKSRLSQAKITDKSQVHWLMNRKWNVTSELANQLMKLAASRRLAVLLINQTHTKIKGLPRATLSPLLAGGAWENSVYTRIVLYRDLPAVEDEESEMASRSVRYAEVLKRDGKALPVRSDENIVPFTIDSGSLRRTDPTQPSRAVPQQPVDQTFRAGGRKRKVDEIADSQDEDDSDDDFGWVDGDDAGLVGGPADD